MHLLKYRDTREQMPKNHENSKHKDNFEELGKLEINILNWGRGASKKTKKIRAAA